MITAKLSKFIVETQTGDIPSATREMLTLSMLDWAACGLAGANEPVSNVVRSMALAEAGKGEAQLFRSDQRVPARAAALVNGTTSHALDYDDTHFAHIGHPSVAVFPAALALAERNDLDGEQLQTAALIGIETSIRVGVWLGRNHYQAGFHQTGTAGAFGAAAAAARLLGFDHTQTAATLGLVSTRASGLKSQFGTMGKPYNAGLAASNGVEAALLVAGGFQPNPEALEVSQGFGATHSGQGIASAMGGLGEDWLFDGISHKFHACCHGLHATLEALAEINRPPVAEISEISILTHPRWMSVCNQLAPTTGLGAKFSYRLVTAMALCGYSTAALESYSDAVCADPEIVALRDKVIVSTSDTLTETQSRAVIRLADGTEISARHDLDAPIPISDRTQRLQAKSVALIGAKKTDQLWKLIHGHASARSFAAALAG